MLGLTLGLSGGLAVPVAAFTVLASALVVVGFLKSGDTIPALLYWPTLLIRIGLLFGWS